jgi:hypothetical protein
VLKAYIIRQMMLNEEVGRDKFYFFISAEEKELHFMAGGINKSVFYFEWVAPILQN